MAIKIQGTTVIDDNRNISSVGVATIGSGNSTTTIDGNTGIVNVGTGITMQGILGNISIAGTLTAAGLNIPPTVTTFSPAIGATNVALDPTIDLTFNQWVGVGTTGTIVFREGSVNGVGVKTVFVSAASSLSRYQIRFTYSGSPLSPLTTYFPVFSPQLITSDSGQFVGINTGGGPSYSFVTTDFTLSSINPSAGATNVGVSTNITLTFSGTPTRGTGTIQLKSGSATTGTLIESFDAASSDRISVSGSQWILDPTNNLGFSTTIHTIIPSTAIYNYIGLNTTGVGVSSHSFTTRAIVLGESYEGGFVICQSGGTRWVVAPSSSEVSRNWNSRADANTRAQQVSGCTGWFVPDIGQLQNPGYTCRTYWDSYASVRYWSNTSCVPAYAPPGAFCVCAVNFATGAGSVHSGGSQPTYCVRSLRCVTY